MLIVEFCKMCQIDGTEMDCRYDEPSKSVVVTWKFPVPNHPTVTHCKARHMFKGWDLCDERIIKFAVESIRQQLKFELEKLNNETT